MFRQLLPNKNKIATVPGALFMPEFRPEFGHLNRPQVWATLFGMQTIVVFFLSEGVHPEWIEGVHFKTKRINKSSLTPTTCMRCWWVVPWTRLGVITLGIPVIAQLWPTKMLLVFPWIHRKVAGYASRSELYYDYPLDRCYTYVLSIHRLHVDYSLGAIIFVYARVDQTLLYVGNRL
jgi:hypothetical protein